MRLSSLALLVVVVAAASAEEAEGPFGGLRSAVEPRLAASGLRIARMEDEIGQLSEAIDEAGHVDPLGYVLEMHARLNDVEGNPCARKRHLQCGWETMDCVSHLAICDGHTDCHNGWDESDEVCAPGPMVAGNVFTGIANWQSCLPLREHPVSLKITGTLASKIYASRLGITAQMVANIPALEIHRIVYLKGYYVLGAKKLVLVPQDYEPSNQRYGLACHFNRGDDLRADCRLLTEASLFTCATARLTLEEQDMHHTRHHYMLHRRDRDHRGERIKHLYDIEGHDVGHREDDD